MLRLCSLLVLFLSIAPVLSQAGPSGPARVIDGDTVEVAGTRIRLHGIDAPEVAQTCSTEQGVRFACGTWVTDQTRQLLLGKWLRCTQVDTDRYGRMVATCDMGGQDLGQVLVERGLAFAYRKYSMAYDLDEKRAAIMDRGLHALRIQSPSQFRKTRAVGRFPTDPNCRIKGNISAKGRIFHEPGQENYEVTGIRPEKGERWFCTASEARKAGWRRARR